MCVEFPNILENLLISKPLGKIQIWPFFPYFCFSEQSFIYKASCGVAVTPSMVCSVGRHREVLFRPNECRSRGMTEQETGTRHCQMQGMQ